MSPKAPVTRKSWKKPGAILRRNISRTRACPSVKYRFYWAFRKSAIFQGRLNAGMGAHPVSFELISSGLNLSVAVKRCTATGGRDDLNTPFDQDLIFSLFSDPEWTAYSFRKLVACLILLPTFCRDFVTQLVCYEILIAARLTVKFTT